MGLLCQWRAEYYLKDKKSNRAWWLKEIPYNKYLS